MLKDVYYNTMLLKFLFQFLRIFNANSPGLHEARWALKNCTYEDSVKKIFILRSEGKSLKEISDKKGISQEQVRSILIKGASQARLIKKI